MLLPRDPTVTRRGHHRLQREGVALAEAVEVGVADVHVAEERAGLGVVCPDLLLVQPRAERRLWSGEVRPRPVGLDCDPLRRHLVDARHGHPEEAVLAGAGVAHDRVGEVRGEIGVVETIAVGPGEPVRTRRGPERHPRVTTRAQAVLVVIRHGVDRADVRGARLGGRAAVGRGQARVRRLDPGVATVEREVHAAKPNAEVEGAEWERAGRVLGGRGPRARLHVDQVVGAGGEHVRPDGADRQRGLVLGILWVIVGGAADTDQSVSSRCGMCRRSAYRAQRKDNGHHQRSSRGTHNGLLSARPRSGRAKRSPHRWPGPGQTRPGVSLGPRRRYWTPSPPSRRAAVSRSSVRRELVRVDDGCLRQSGVRGLGLTSPSEAPANRPRRRRVGQHADRRRPARPHPAVLGPVPADNAIRARQAACSYSRRTPPRRSRRWMSRWASRCGSVIGSGSGARGRALAMP
jgi:hypothetical protein